MTSQDETILIGLNKFTIFFLNTVSNFFFELDGVVGTSFISLISENACERATKCFFRGFMLHLLISHL